MGIGCVKVKGVYERRKSAKYELASNQSTGNSSQDKNIEEVWNYGIMVVYSVC